MRSQNISCDIYTQKADTIHYVQGEKGREIKFSFINSATSDNVDLTGLTVTIHILKSDGNFTIDTLTHGSEYATYTLTENDCIVGGMGVYDLSISDANTIIYTAHGDYIGDNKAIADGTVNSVSIAYGVPFPEGFQEKLIPGANITIVDNVISSTGGGGGTTDYTQLINKPSINGVTLQGNKTSADLNITDTTYTAGSGLDLTGTTFSLDSATQSTLSAVAGKQDQLTAGTNITIDANNVISASGGTSVIANPIETPTDDLNTIQIGSVVYDITGSGGGSGYTETVLWSGSPEETSITLSDSVLNYDAIYVEAKFNNEAYIVNTIDKATFVSYLGNDYISLGSHSNTYFGITPTSTATHFVFFGANYNGCTRVIGLKYARGGGSDQAIDINYDNTTSGLTATNVQGAIDEIDANVDTLNSKLIKRGTPINATTNANGNVDLGIKVSEKIILNAWIYSQTAHCRCILWANSTTEPTWQITAINNASMAQHGNLAVTINYVYIDAI